MLLELSEQLYTDLSSYAPLVALLSKGTSSIRPLMGEAKDGDVFITYAIRYTGQGTKVGLQEYEVVIRCWAMDYDSSIEVADRVFDALRSSGNYSKYVSAEPIYNEQQEIYTQQIFNLKK